jgi:uncharacterized C2H2 Zn-finger protein
MAETKEKDELEDLGFKEIPEDLFKCPICKRVYEDYDSLMDHIRRSHGHKPDKEMVDVRTLLEETYKDRAAELRKERVERLLLEEQVRKRKLEEILKEYEGYRPVQQSSLLTALLPLITNKDFAEYWASLPKDQKDELKDLILWISMSQSQVNPALLPFLLLKKQPNSGNPNYNSNPNENPWLKMVEMLEQKNNAFIEAIARLAEKKDNSEDLLKIIATIITTIQAKNSSNDVVVTLLTKLIDKLDAVQKNDVNKEIREELNKLRDELAKAREEMLKKEMEAILKLKEKEAELERIKLEQKIEQLVSAIRTPEQTIEELKKAKKLLEDIGLLHRTAEQEQRELIKEGLNAIKTALENIGKPIAEKIGEGIRQGMLARIESQRIPKVQELVKEVQEVNPEVKAVNPEINQETTQKEDFFKIV